MKKVSRSRIWIRMTIARREMRRAQKTLREVIESNKERESSLIYKYEVALAKERLKIEKLHKEWADRFLQLNKQQPMFVDLENIETPPRLETKEPTSDIEQTMDYDTRQLYLDRKDQFWEDGEDLGQSPAAISQEWNKIRLKVADDCIGQSKVQYNDE